MKERWSSVALGDILRRSEAAVAVQPNVSYQEITVRLWGKGVVQRGVVTGAEIAGNRRFVARTGQLILSRIDARHGALGIVPPSLDGALVSNDFPLFDVAADRLDPTFIGWLVKTNDFVELCRRASEGTTNRVRLQEDSFLRLKISLPSLEEQRRIVARIEQASLTTTSAKTLRRQAITAADALVSAHVGVTFERLARTHPVRQFSFYSPHVTSGPRDWAKRYEDSGYRFYRAQDIGPAGKILDDSKVFVAPPGGRQGQSAMLRAGDVMLVITGATVGRVSTFRDSLEPGFVSQHVAICRFSDDVDGDFVRWGLRGPNGQRQLLGQRYGQGKPGLNLSNIRALQLPFPSRTEQRSVISELERVQEFVEQLQSLQRSASSELNALLPSILDRAFKGDL